MAKEDKELTEKKVNNKKVICTHNIVPDQKSVSKNDIDKFLKANYSDELEKANAIIAESREKEIKDKEKLKAKNKPEKIENT